MSESTHNNVVRSPSLSPPSVYQVPVFDEFYPEYPETEFDDEIDPINHDSVKPPVMPEDHVSISTDAPAQEAPNPWQRLTRAAKAKFKY